MIDCRKLLSRFEDDEDDSADEATEVQLEMMGATRENVSPTTLSWTGESW